MKENNGIYIPLITPFKCDGEVDYAGLKRATKYVLKNGADGIYAVGGSAEFMKLSIEERKKCLEVIISAADGKTVIAHVGSTSIRESLELARHAEKVGANMLSAVAPYYFNYTFEQVKDYFFQIAEATSLPLMIYNAAQGRTYTLEEQLVLMNHDKITAMKFTNFNYYHLERLIYAYPNKKFYTGADEGFISGQIVGAAGAIGTTFNCQSEKFLLAKKLIKEGKNAQALEVMHSINNIVNTLLNTNTLIVATKYLMALDGLDIDCYSRGPNGDLTEEQKEYLKKVYFGNKLI